MSFSWLNCNTIAFYFSMCKDLLNFFFNIKRLMFTVIWWHQEENIVYGIVLIKKNKPNT